MTIKKTTTFQLVCDFCKEVKASSDQEISIHGKMGKDGWVTFNMNKGVQTIDVAQFNVCPDCMKREALRYYPPVVKDEDGLIENFVLAYDIMINSPMQRPQWYERGQCEQARKLIADQFPDQTVVRETQAIWRGEPETPGRFCDDCGQAVGRKHKTICGYIERVRTER